MPSAKDHGSSEFGAASMRELPRRAVIQFLARSPITVGFSAEFQDGITGVFPDQPSAVAPVLEVPYLVAHPGLEREIRC